MKRCTKEESAEIGPTGKPDIRVTITEKDGDTLVSAVVAQVDGLFGSGRALYGVSLSHLERILAAAQTMANEYQASHVCPDHGRWEIDHKLRPPLYTCPTCEEEKSHEEREANHARRLAHDAMVMTHQERQAKLLNQGSIQVIKEPRDGG